MYMIKTIQTINKLHMSNKNLTNLTILSKSPKIIMIHIKFKILWVNNNKNIALIIIIKYILLYLEIMEQIFNLIILKITSFNQK